MNNIYYYTGSTQVGPVNFEDLRRASINRETLVWYEGLAEWKKAGEVPELNYLFTPVQAAQSYNPPMQAGSVPFNPNSTVGNRSQSMFKAPFSFVLSGNPPIALARLNTNDNLSGVA